jgi:hypothetical protein
LAGASASAGSVGSSVDSARDAASRPSADCGSPSAPTSIASIVIRSAWSAVAWRTFAIQAGEESTARMRAPLWWATQIVELPQPYSP